MPPGAGVADRAGSSIGLVTGIGQRDQEVSLVRAFVAAAHDLDVPAMERILDEGFASHRFELAIEGLVSPAMRAIGIAWAQDELDVGAEHAASETVRRRLARFYDAAGLGDRVPRVIVGLPPDGQHEIGAFAFAVAARRAGLEVLYLGANVPLESWLRTVQETSAPVVVMGVVIAVRCRRGGRRDRRARRVGQTADLPRRRARCPPIRSTALGTIRLPTPLDDAVAAVARLLGSDERPPR